MQRRIQPTQSSSITIIPDEQLIVVMHYIEIMLARLFVGRMSETRIHSITYHTTWIYYPNIIKYNSIAK